MRAIVDRVEDGVAVILLDHGGRAYVPAEHLPPGAGEGTVLRLEWRVETTADAGEVAALIERLRAQGEDHQE
jgi:hypothetical protein